MKKPRNSKPSPNPKPDVNAQLTPQNPRVAVNERLIGVARSIRKHCGPEEAQEAAQVETQLEARIVELNKAEKNK